jgi:hypothetical protein
MTHYTRPNGDDNGFATSQGLAKTLFERRLLVEFTGVLGVDRLFKWDGKLLFGCSREAQTLQDYSAQFDAL